MKTLFYAKMFVLKFTTPSESKLEYISVSNVCVFASFLIVEILPCNPNPCQHGSACSVSDGGEPVCDCFGAYTGDYCETLLVHFPPVPFLVLNQSYSFTIYAFPDTILNIEIITTALIDVTPSHLLQILPGESNVTFELTPHLEGMFQLSYALQSPDGTAMMETAVVSAGIHSPSNYFDSLGLPRGILGIGCCAFESSSLESLCASLPPGQPSLVSSCSWTGSDDGSSFATSGVTFITSQALNLPLSIAGMDGTVQDGLNTNLPNPSLECSSCNYNRSSKVGCYQYETTPSYVDNMLSSHALLQTFLAAIDSILPQQASIKLDGARENAAVYQPFDYQAAITSVFAGNMAAGCGTLKLPDGMYYILRTKAPLSVSLATETLILTPSDSVCFGVNICSGLYSSVIMSIGEGSVNPLSSTSYLADFYNAGFDVSVQSIELSAQGLDTLNEKGFWNGSGHYQPSVPSYDLRIQVLLSGDVGTAILTSFKFSGEISMSLTQGSMVSKHANIHVRVLPLHTCVHKKAVCFSYHNQALHIRTHLHVHVCTSIFEQICTLSCRQKSKCLL